MSEEKIEAILFTPIDVQRLLGVSQSKFEEIRDIEGFPKPIRPTKRPMYFKAEIEQWLKDLPRAAK